MPADQSTYNTSLDPISPDFTLKSWTTTMTAEDQRRLDYDEVCCEPDGCEWIEEASMFAHDILVHEMGQCAFCGEEV